MAADDDPEKIMARPQWKFEWNLNTIVILLAFAGSIAAWGATWARVTDGQDANRLSIERLDKRTTLLEALPRLIDNHEFRIANVEKQVNDSAVALRTVETSLNSLASDMRVTREILQRIEAGQRTRRTGP